MASARQILRVMASITATNHLTDTALATGYNTHWDAYCKGLAAVRGAFPVTLLTAALGAKALACTEVDANAKSSTTFLRENIILLLAGKNYFCLVWSLFVSMVRVRKRGQRQKQTLLIIRFVLLHSQWIGNLILDIQGEQQPT